MSGEDDNIRHDVNGEDLTLDGARTLLKIPEHADSSAIQRLGQYTVEGVPKRPAGEESVDVRFTYDLNGILEVDTTINSTGRTLSLVIERSPGRLSKQELSAARARMRTLKLHPRDALPNVTALARADALHVELVGIERIRLVQAIAAFRLALEGQDPDEIARWRGALITATEELRRAT